MGGAAQPASIGPSPGGGTTAATRIFSGPGVYTVKANVQDDDGGAGSANTVKDLPAFVVAYDPSSTFVAGGGWFMSPKGAYSADPLFAGKATFGFVTKCRNGTNGEAAFEFRAAGLTFESGSHNWVLVTGPAAWFLGLGTVNGISGYAFLITAIDGQILGGADRFRIRIWDTKAKLVYDNERGNVNPVAATALGGGSIVIHMR